MAPHDEHEGERHAPSVAPPFAAPGDALAAQPARLRVIRDGALPGAENMRRDAELLAACRPGDDPILRIYRWDPPAVSLGFHQKLADFDAATCAARGWDLVRRPTGGRAILHCDEITYAVVAPSPSPIFGSTLNEAYAAINRALLLFLQRLGIRPDVSGGESLAEARGLVCFRSAGRHEILIKGRKIVGSAQRRTADAFLQHGSILTGPGHAGLVEVLASARAGGQSRAALLAGTTDLAQELNRPLGELQLQELGDLLAAAFGYLP
jgi:lipoate-protein ligase A